MCACLTVAKLIAHQEVPTKDHTDPGGVLALTGDPGCLFELSRNRRSSLERGDDKYRWLYYRGLNPRNPLV